ncbi:MAG: pyrroline-5-carboxylate reductase [Gammaproteobacteria bacterium]|jgi:pyrroline-5-carboxylate reductase
MDSPTITFIGGGNMATSLIGGLRAQNQPGDQIWVSDPDLELLGMHQQRFAVHTSADNALATRHADIVVLAVKPQVMRDVALGLRESVQNNKPLVLSVAAGVREADMQRWLGGDVAIVRCMPNTPALLGAGATGLFANAQVTGGQRVAAENILRAAGLVIWVENEVLLDAVTAVSGSGPAYFFLLMEMMEKVGVELGLDAEGARALTLQTALGAARMALESGDSPGVLRKRVTSPGGTTERAVNSFIDGGLEDQVRSALRAARDRAIALGEQLGEN